MPAALTYQTLDQWNSPEWRKLEEIYSKEAGERQKRFEKNWKYYDGDMPLPLKIELDGMNDNILLSLVDQLTDKCVSFLIGDGVKFDVGDGSDELASVIDELFGGEAGRLLQNSIALTGALTGHVFCRIEPQDGGPPRIVNLDPKFCAVFWDMEDIDNVLWYRLEYTQGDYAKRIDYVKGDWTNEIANPLAEVWTEFVYVRGAGGTWKETSRNLWEYPWPPIVEWQNIPRPHSYYGTDDVSKAIQLNNAANFIISNYNRILKHHGHPKTVGLGFKPSEIVETKVGGLFSISKPPTEASVFNLEMQSDLGSARELLSIVIRQFWNTGKMLDPQSIKDSIGQLTNFGLRVLYTDALKKTETKRMLYEQGFETILVRALELMGYTVDIEKIDTIWPDVLPEDESILSNAIRNDVEAGLCSKQTAAEKLGYDWEQEQQRIEEEKASQSTIGEQILASFARGQ